MYVYKIRKIGSVDEWWGDRKFTKRGKVWLTLHGAKTMQDYVERRWKEKTEIVKYELYEIGLTCKGCGLINNRCCCSFSCGSCYSSTVYLCVRCCDHKTKRTAELVCDACKTDPEKMEKYSKRNDDEQIKKVFNDTYSMKGETQQEACERIARGLNG